MSQLTIDGSPELFAQMLDNAVDFAHSNTQINVTLNKDEGLTVMNIGDGIPESMADALFDTMVSVRAESDTDTGLHLGLGLHLAKMIAEYHGFKIQSQEKPQALLDEKESKCVVVSCLMQTNKSTLWPRVLKSRQYIIDRYIIF